MVDRTRPRVPSPSGVARERRGSLVGALQAIGRPVFTTKELAAIRRTSVSSAAQTLERLAQDGAVMHVRRGLWAVPSDPRYSPLALVAHLAAGHPAYVSFLTALRLHGMIEQIPQVVYVATTAHSRQVRTPAGAFSFHRIAPAFFDGFDWYGDRQTFLVASPEKALVDCLYLSGRRGRRFARLVDLDLTGDFRIEEARRWIAKIDDPRLRRFAAGRLDTIWQGTRAGAHT